jgi:Flp pilus assembly protein TadD
MPHDNWATLVQQGTTAMSRGDTLTALLSFQDAAKVKTTPILCSNLAYCLARERRQMQKGISLCSEALVAEPANPLHYLNLGRIYLLAGKKDAALQTFRQGLKMGKSSEIMAELKKLGIRKDAVLPTLSRSHPLNRYLGLVLHRLGLR